MELAAFVTLRLPSIILRLTGTELSKILCSLGNYVLIQLHLDPPQLLPYVLMSVIHARPMGPLRSGQHVS